MSEEICLASTGNQRSSGRFWNVSKDLGFKEVNREMAHTTYTYKNRLERAQKAWVIDAYCNDNIQSAKYSTEIGFDLVKCRVRILAIDWDKLEGIIQKSGLITMESPNPEDHIRCDLGFGNKPILNLPGNTKYSSIIIAYPYFSLRLIPSNRPLKSDNNRDIRQLSVHVVPSNKKLRNLNNFSCTELQKRIKEILDFLEETFGIALDGSDMVINYFEMNRNYAYSGNDLIPFFRTAFMALPDRFAIVPKSVPWGQLGTADSVGIFANASTLGIHLYDKILDIENADEDIYIDKPNKIYRIEFIVKKEKQVNSWLKTSNPMDLNQQTLEEAYFNFQNKYLIKMFYEQYNSFYNYMVGSHRNDSHNIVFETSDKHWTDAFCQELIVDAAIFNVDTKFLGPDFVKSLLRELDDQSGTLKSNLSRCVKMIVKKSDGKINDEDHVGKIRELLLSTSKNYKINYILNNGS